MAGPRVAALGALLFGVVGFLVGPGAAPALACTCAATTDLAHHRAVDLVFTGVATDHRDPNASSGVVSSADPIVWTFEVESVDKGRVPESVEVHTARFGGSCGYGFEQGLRYQVFGRLQDGQLWTSICDGTRSLTAGEDAFHLREPRAPEAGGTTVGEPRTPPPGLGSLAIPLGPLVVAFGSVLVGMGYHHLRRTRD